MRPRITSPALSVPGVLDALQALSKAANEPASQAGLSRSTFDLVSLRASQINVCAVCLDIHSRAVEKAGEVDGRLFPLAALARSALLQRCRACRSCADRGGYPTQRSRGPVPDEVWNEAAKHCHEPELAALVVCIAAINAWNRLNVTTGQIAGEWTAQWVA